VSDNDNIIIFISFPVGKIQGITVITGNNIHSTDITCYYQNDITVPAYIW
jgi:hypothetical protein